MKYNYLKIIQVDYGQGWEDVDAHECDSTGWINNPEARTLLKFNMRAYQENELRPYRIIFRRELREVEGAQ